MPLWEKLPLGSCGRFLQESYGSWRCGFAPTSGGSYLSGATGIAGASHHWRRLGYAVCPDGLPNATYNGSEWGSDRSPPMPASAGGERQLRVARPRPRSPAASRPPRRTVASPEARGFESHAEDEAKFHALAHRRDVVPHWVKDWRSLQRDAKKRPRPPRLMERACAEDDDKQSLEPRRPSRCRATGGPRRRRPKGGARGAPWIHAPASASPSATNALSSVSCRASAVATAFAHATLSTPQPSRRWSAFMTSSAKPLDKENAPTAVSTQSVPYGPPHAATKRASVRRGPRPFL